MLDTQRESAFDNIVFTAAQLFRVRTAAFCLVDGERVWSKAFVGPLPRQWARDQSLCTLVVETGQLLVVEDASVDARFTNLITLGPGIPIRFFAGAPIKGPAGLVMGVLAVFDQHPRTAPERQQIQLLQLAAHAGELLRIRVPNLDLSI